MGLAVALIRMTQLKLEQMDLEYKVMLISDAKMNIGRTITDLINVGTDMSPDSPIVKKLEQRKERLHLLEKKLDIQMAQYQLRLKCIEQEQQSCMHMIDKNIQRSFKY